MTSTAATLAWRPDTGRDTDPVWGEGTNLRRQENLNCLYSVTHDSRLVPLISAVAKANLDPQRYYGPPLHPAHNHGLMANLALLNASVLLARSDWRAAALGRMRTALDASFSPAGLSIEQSSAYHQSVLAKWVAASRLLRDIGGADTTDLKAAVDAVILRASRALDFLLMPDGIPVPFGDQVGLRRVPTPTARHLLVDPVAGVLAGRWSWAAPDDFVAARFGGPRQMHGHEDRMSVVWWATGRPVLADPGTSTYVAGPARDWVVGPLSHNVPTVPGHAFVPKAPITISSVQASRLYAFTLSGRPWDVAQSRRVVVDPSADRLTLTDTATARVSPVLQLDHRWAARTIDSAHRVATFVDGTGAVLTIRTTGRISSIKRGQAGLAGGWTFSYPPERRAAAARIVITGGTSVVTTLQVKGAGLTPWVS